MNCNLTVGRPSAVLCRFCLPLLGSVFFQQLYLIADSLIAGKCIGENALAAVGNGYEITLVYLAFSVGSSIGCSVVVSRLFGSGRHAELKTATRTAFIAGAAICVLLATAYIVFGDALLRLIKTPDAIYADSRVYLNIYTVGLPFVFFYNIATGVFSALGDSVTPFLLLAVSSGANVAADLYFVRSLGMGVEGVAYATLLCQTASCFAALLLLCLRMRRFKTGKVPFFSLTQLLAIARIALPSILQQSFISVGNIIIQRTINGFGEGVTAGYSAAIKLNNLIITVFTTLGNGMSNFTAQNLGAGKPDRLRPGFYAGLRLAWCLCLPVIPLYFLAAEELIRLFVDSPTPEAMESGVLFLRVVSPFYLIVSSKHVSDGMLRGAGYMGRFLSATFTSLMLRVILSLILSVPFGSLGIWLSWPFGWAIAAAMSVLLCRPLYRKSKGIPSSDTL